ncbi:proline-rich transmembrane protein 2-like [Ruditapes philippinarum]|uniref:proline-rich transmembrane protein 2-like n=1 Tax=Ruditapes philippinarum TaxID=129788 RepID=UPI00295B14F9|nr:proline-rich transmembrane protein 2-like [Ruditapes philippinarum]
MAERAGYDQPDDGYTYKYAKIKVDVLHPYQPDILTSQQGNGQQPYPFQQSYRHDTNTKVVVTQPEPGIAFYHKRPPDYMIGSILACFCCFWPTGICAIFYANEANYFANAGDYAGARRMSDNAKKLMITSVFIGIIFVGHFCVLEIDII